MSKWTQKDRLLRLIKRDGPGCWICGRAVAVEPNIDHVIPLSRGGSNGMSNLKVACKKCNSIKGNKLPAPDVLAVVRYQIAESVVNAPGAPSYEEQLQQYFKRARKRYVTKYEPGLTTEQRIALQKQDEEKRRR